MDTENKELENRADEKAEEIVEDLKKQENTEEIDKMEVIDYDIDDSIDMLNNIPKLKNDEKKSKEKEPFDLKKEIISWIKMIVAAILLAVVITNFIIINATVPTSSMEDTIPTKSRIMGLRLSYLFNDPERLDIIVFNYQFEDDVKYVKRVIGLPGEKIVISNGTINVYNGDELVETLDETYLKEEWTNKNDGYTFEVPEGRYFVLGDNRNYSQDTRAWYDNYYRAGKCSYDDLFIDESEILGKVYFTYFPKFSFVND